jgi:hypothetical protein
VQEEASGGRSSRDFERVRRLSDGWLPSGRSRRAAEVQLLALRNNSRAARGSRIWRLGRRPRAPLSQLQRVGMVGEVGRSGGAGTRRAASSKALGWSSANASAERVRASQYSPGFNRTQQKLSAAAWLLNGSGEGAGGEARRAACWKAVSSVAGLSLKARMGIVTTHDGSHSTHRMC